ncbi:fimbrial protein [Serratia fonticola]|uniref:fimbrial protein n=1 Tax=Serratia fonticola TaxID=47917 RepID=UPI0034C64475
MSIKQMSFIVFPCLFPFLIYSAHAANWGRVNMQGAIIDTACAISVASREQTIDMGIVPLGEVARDGQGRSKPFSIDLVNCVTERPGKADWKQFQVTFDGDAEGSLFGVRGEASGVALKILDSEGHIATPGKALPLITLTPGSKQLNYTLRLVANRHALKSGNYFSVVRFKLDYF